MAYTPEIPDKLAGKRRLTTDEGDASADRKGSAEENAGEESILRGASPITDLASPRGGRPPEAPPAEGKDDEPELPAEEARDPKDQADDPTAEESPDPGDEADDAAGESIHINPDSLVQDGESTGTNSFDISQGSGDPAVIDPDSFIQGGTPANSNTISNSGSPDDSDPDFGSGEATATDPDTDFGSNTNEIDNPDQPETEGVDDGGEDGASPEADMLEELTRMPGSPIADPSPADPFSEGVGAEEILESDANIAEVAVAEGAAEAEAAEMDSESFD